MFVVMIMVMSLMLVAVMVMIVTSLHLSFYRIAELFYCRLKGLL